MIECDQIVDMLVKDSRLLLLLEREGKHVLSESTDLVHLNHYVISPEIDRPLSVEFDGARYYLGLSNGSVLTATRPVD